MALMAQNCRSNWHCHLFDGTAPPFTKDKSTEKKGAIIVGRPTDPLIFRSSAPSQGGKKRAGVKQTKTKKGKKPSIIESANLEKWFEDTSLCGESTKRSRH